MQNGKDGTQMKATGIVRRIDELGRVVIPKEIRRTQRIRRGGSGRRDLADRSVSQPLEKVMESRKPYLSEGDPEHVLLPCEGSLRPLLCAWPIIAAGDVTGAVGLLAEDRTQQPDPAQQKAVAVAAAFLAKQMEE